MNEDVFPIQDGGFSSQLCLFTGGVILTKLGPWSLLTSQGVSLFDRQVTGDRTSLAAYLDPQIFR